MATARITFWKDLHSFESGTITLDTDTSRVGTTMRELHEDAVGIPPDVGDVKTYPELGKIVIETSAIDDYGDRVVVTKAVFD